MRRLFFVCVFALVAVPAGAQYPVGVSPPVFVIPASAMNGAGVVTCPQGIGTTSTDCVLIANNTPATAGVTVQLSPRVRLSGTAWTGSASKTVSFFTEVLPATAATPTGTWKLGYQLEGVAATYPLTVSSVGVLTSLSGMVVGGNGVQVPGTGTYSWATTAMQLSTLAANQWVFQNNAGNAGFGIDTSTDALLKVRTRAQTGYATVDALAYQMNGAGNATSNNKIIKKVTAIADAVATNVLTVTILNANHAGTLVLKFTSSNGGADAFESTRTASGQIAIARTTGVNVVATAATLDDAAIATVAGGATHTLAYGVSAIAGAVGAVNTFTVQVTIDDSGGTGGNQCVVLAELINAEATGITIQ